jgi:hypothetical protein
MLIRSIDRFGRDGMVLPASPTLDHSSLVGQSLKLLRLVLVRPQICQLVCLSEHPATFLTDI